jgi:type IV pilus assembly protein PilW
MKAVKNPRFVKNHEGLTIVELMVALTLGMFVILVASAVLLAGKAAYTNADDSARIYETGTYAFGVVGRAINQTSFVNWEKEDGAILTAATDSADIYGFDSRTLSSNSPDIKFTKSGSVNGSDVLAVRYFGAGAGENGDGTILNCAGFGVPAAQSNESAEESRGWSIFYVAVDKAGESELRCKYRGKTSWTSESIARGVESFQVLYGIDTDSDGMPNQFISATSLNDLDGRLLLKGDNAFERELYRRRKTNWKNVVSIKVAMLIRGSQIARSDALSKQYDLFGVEYSSASAFDLGVAINEENIPASERNRMRKIFQQTFVIRNQAMQLKI